MGALLSQRGLAPDYDMAQCISVIARLDPYVVEPQQLQEVASTYLHLPAVYKQRGQNRRTNFGSIGSLFWALAQFPSYTAT